MQETYNSQIRHFISSFKGFIVKINEINNKSENVNDEFLYLNILMNASVHLSVLDERFLSKKFIYITFSSVLVVMFSDFFISLNRIDRFTNDENLEILNYIKTKLEEMRKAKNMNDVYNCLNDFRLITISNLTDNFKNLSVYEKVLLMKSLKESDVSLLSKINPFFMEEYDRYNVTIDEKFLNRQIKKWQNIWKDDIEKSYIDASSFLDEYKVLDPNLFNSLSEEYEASESKDIVKKLYISLKEDV